MEKKKIEIEVTVSANGMTYFKIYEVVRVYKNGSSVTVLQTLSADDALFWEQYHTDHAEKGQHAVFTQSTLVFVDNSKEFRKEQQ